MSTYISLNNYCVQQSSNPKIIDEKILDLFTDTITMDYYRNPVYIADSQKIYELDSIRKWLLTSDIDPLSGLKISREKINYCPALNIFFAMLCLELKDDILYYHAPRGNIFDLMYVIKNIYQGNNLSSHHAIPAITIDLDLRNYFKINHETVNENFSILNCKDHNNYNFDMDYYELDLESILIMCPLSRKIYDNSCVMNAHGFFIHPKTHEKHIRKIYKNNFASMMSSFSPENIFITSHFIDYFKNNMTEIIHNNNDDRHYCNLTNINDDDKIIYNSAMCEIKFDYQSDVVYRHRWSYLNVTSYTRHIYNLYLKYKEMIDANSMQILSKIFTVDIKSGKCIIIPPHNRNYIKLRHFYGLPNFYDEEITYGTDASFLSIENHIFTGHYKCIYFIGTKFNNVQFIDCTLSDCIFIGAEFINCGFTNCRDLREDAFYKTFIPNLVNTILI